MDITTRVATALREISNIARDIDQTSIDAAAALQAIIDAANKASATIHAIRDAEVQKRKDFIARKDVARNAQR